MKLGATAEAITGSERHAMQTKRENHCKRLVEKGEFLTGDLPERDGKEFPPRAWEPSPLPGHPQGPSSPSGAAIDARDRHCYQPSFHEPQLRVVDFARVSGLAEGLQILNARPEQSHRPLAGLGLFEQGDRALDDLVRVARRLV